MQYDLDYLERLNGASDAQTAVATSNIVERHFIRPAYEADMH